MSRTQLVLRASLVLLLVGSCFVGYRVWQMNSPDHYWLQAEKAMVAEKHAEAIPYLRNLVRKQEEHGRGHAALAHALVEVARATTNPQATYATTPEAFEHLKQAAKLLPDDMAVRRDLLRAYVKRGNLDQATMLARQLYPAEPDNAEALYMLARDALRNGDYQKTVELTQVGLAQPTDYGFPMLTLQAAAYQSLKDTKNFQNTLAATCRVAAGVTPAQFRGLDLLVKHVVLPELMTQAVVHAEQPEVALTRAEQAVTALTHMLDSETVDPRIPTVQVARLVTGLDDKFPPARLDAAQRERRLALHARIDTLIERGLSLDSQIPDDQKQTILDFYLVAAQQALRKDRLDHAQRAIDVLAQNTETAGWGALLAGRVAARRGHHERALEHFLRARDLLGAQLQVRQSLAATYYQLRRWKEALPLLASLHVAETDLNAEQREWASQSVGSASGIHLMQLIANLGLNRWEDALRHFEPLKGTDVEAEAAAALIAHMWNHGQGEAAKNLLGEARRKYPRDLAFVQIEASILTLEGKPDDADSLFERYALAHPHDLAVQTAWCQRLADRGKNQESLEQLLAIESKLTATEAGRKVALLLHSRSLLGLGRVAEAAEVARPLLEDPKFAAYASGLAIAAADGDTAKIARAVEEASRLHPDNPIIALNRGGLAAEQGDYTSAMLQFAALLDTTSISPQTEQAAVQTLLKMAGEQGPEAALVEVEKLLTRAPNHPVLGIARAEFLVRLGREAEALAQLEDLQRRFPDHAGVTRVKAHLLLQRDQANEALVELERAVAQDPTLTEPVLTAAKVAASLEQHDRAVALLDSLLERDSRNVEAAVLKATLLASRKQFDAAVAALEPLKVARPDAPEVYLALAGVYTEAGARAAALAALREGRQAMPENTALALAELQESIRADDLAAAETIAQSLIGAGLDAAPMVAIGQTYARLGHTDGALTWWKKALAVANPSQRASVHLLVGDALLRKNQETPDIARLEEAKEHYEAVLRDEPDNMLAANNLAWMLAVDLAQPAGALHWVENVLRKQPANRRGESMAHTMAVVYRLNGRLADARDVLESSLASHPDQPKLLLERGQVAADMGDLDQARASLRRALQLGLTEGETLEAQAILNALGLGAAERLRTSLP